MSLWLPRDHQVTCALSRQESQYRRAGVLTRLGFVWRAAPRWRYHRTRNGPALQPRTGGGFLTCSDRTPWPRMGHCSLPIWSIVGTRVGVGATELSYGLDQNARLAGEIGPALGVEGESLGTARERDRRLGPGRLRRRPPVHVCWTPHGAIFERLLYEYDATSIRLGARQVAPRRVYALALFSSAASASAPEALSEQLPLIGFPLDFPPTRPSLGHSTRQLSLSFRQTRAY